VDVVGEACNFWNQISAGSVTSLLGRKLGDSQICDTVEIFIRHLCCTSNL